MTPSQFVARLGKTKIYIHNLELINAPSNFKMLLTIVDKTQSNKTYFNPVDRWHGCRELFSEFVRFRHCNGLGQTKKIEKGQNRWGGPNYSITRTGYKECWGPRNPMCVAVSGISFKQAQQVLSIIKNIEELSGVGHSEVIKCIFTGKKIKGFCWEPNREGVIFVIPRCWTETLPHISLYLLILRTAKDYRSRNWGSFTRNLKNTKDATSLRQLVNINPEFLTIMIKHWKLLASKIKEYKYINNINGIQRLMCQSNSLIAHKKQAKKHPRASVTKNTSNFLKYNVSSEHHELTKCMARLLNRYPNGN